MTPNSTSGCAPAGALPDTLSLHQCVLAYASDFSLLDTALIAHGKLMFDKDMQLASLDHALWFHRPFRADEWLLYAMDSPSSHGARGFCRGSVFTRDGTLVASVAQEGLMRQRDIRGTCLDNRQKLTICLCLDRLPQSPSDPAQRLFPL